MKPDETNVLEMLSSELFDGAPNNIQKNACWNKCLSVARRHSVVPLIYKSIVSEKSKYDFKDNIVSKVRSATFSSIITNERLLRVQNDVLNLMYHAGIRCVVLKGSSVAVLYPHPELRELGDVDILVTAGSFQESVDALILEGYVSNGGGHTVHSSLSKNGVHVELHHAVSVFPENSAGRYAVSLFARALDKTDIALMEDHSFPVLLPVFQLLSLLFHMDRHMKHSGISLRQLCDWAVTVNYYRNIIDQSVLGEFEKCGMLRFAKVLTQTCVIYLRLPDVNWCRDVDKSSYNAMLREILDSGNMSEKSIERSMSSVFVVQRESSIGFQPMIGLYIKNCNMRAKKKYPIAQKIPIILPAFWIITPFQYMIRSYKRDRPKVRYLKLIITACNRKKLYSKLGLFAEHK